MVPHTTARKRISGSRNFRSTPQKDVCNTIVLKADKKPARCEVSEVPVSGRCTARRRGPKSAKLGSCRYHSITSSAETSSAAGTSSSKRIGGLQIDGEFVPYRRLRGAARPGCHPLVRAERRSLSKKVRPRISLRGPTLPPRGVHPPAPPSVLCRHDNRRCETTGSALRQCARVPDG